MYVRMGRFLGTKIGARRRPGANKGDRVPGSHLSSLQERLTARLAGRCRFELLDAAFQRIQPLVGLLRGLIGGFGALRRALHLRVELIQALVDGRELIIVSGAAGKTQGGDERHAERTRRCQMLLGRKHSNPPSSGVPEYSGLFSRSHAPQSADVGMGG